MAGRHVQDHYQPFIIRLFIIMFALIILIMSWEFERNHTVWAGEEIPEDAIRLRILAHSDSARDQWIKNRIRDEIIAYMDQWVETVDSKAEAQKELTYRMSDLEKVVQETLDRYGFHYDFALKLGIVDFPLKVYGNKVYPAGDYHALRVTLGSGKGKNWWCVLFPPLCFVELASADSAIDERVTGEEGQVQGKLASASPSKDHQEEVEVKFFAVEIFDKVKAFCVSLFA